jgi:amino acid transporter
MRAKRLRRLVAGISMVLGGVVATVFVLALTMALLTDGFAGLGPSVLANVLVYLVFILLPAVALFLLGRRAWRKSGLTSN